MQQLLKWKSNKCYILSERIWSLSYPAWYTHAPLSYVVSPALLYFHTLPHKRHDLLKKVIGHQMWILIFSTILSKTLLILRKLKRDMIQYIYVNWLLLLSDLMKLEFPWQIFEKYWNIKFHESSSLGSRAVPWGQTQGRTDRQRDRQTWRNQKSLFAILRKRLKIGE